MLTKKPREESINRYALYHWNQIRSHKLLFIIVWERLQMNMWIYSRSLSCTQTQGLSLTHVNILHENAISYIVQRDNITESAHGCIWFNDSQITIIVCHYWSNHVINRKSSLTGAFHYREGWKAVIREMKELSWLWIIISIWMCSSNEVALGGCDEEWRRSPHESLTGDAGLWEWAEICTAHVMSGNEAGNQTAALVMFLLEQDLSPDRAVGACLPYEAALRCDCGLRGDTVGLLPTLWQWNSMIIKLQ